MLEVLIRLADYLEEMADSYYARQPEPFPGLVLGRPIKQRDIRKFRKLSLSDLGVSPIMCSGCEAKHYPNRRCK